MKEITLDRFRAAYNNHPPAKWVVFAFRHFSKSSTNLRLSNTFVWVLGSLFATGFIATVAKGSRTIRGIITGLFVIILAPLVLFILAAGLTNNRRIRKICKELGISIQEYDKLSDMYLDE